MKISEMPIPFKVNNGMITDASGYHIAASCELAHELCSILNAHFEKLKFDNDEAMEAQMQAAYAKDQLKDTLKKIEDLQKLRAADAETIKALNSFPAKLVEYTECTMCGAPGMFSNLGEKCVGGCHGLMVPMKDDKDKPPPPQPNREETDRTAAEYYKSGRKLEVQFWDSNRWSSGRWKGGDGFNPSFDYSLPWRIKPTKRRVVVDVFALEHSQGFIFSESGSDGAKSFRSDKECKLVGTIEGEVES